ncbi:hypothetical protein bAD24_p00705 (plasmid) [Burkholderia sp. AD24]|nr:hypothetical protein bAD24_p00705 [Burkholderia sp. AD24]
MDGMGFAFGFVFALILIVSSLPLVYRRSGMGGILRVVAALGTLSTAYLAIFIPGAAEIHASESAGPYSQLAAAVLDATHGKWPLVAIAGALSLATVALSVRYDTETAG